MRHLLRLCIEGSRKFYAKSVSFAKLYFLSFLDYLISLISLTMAQIRGKDIDQGYCEIVKWRAPSSLLWLKSPQPLDTLFDFLRWGPFNLALPLCFSLGIAKWWKIYTKLTPDFKNHMRKLDNFRRAVESPKSWNSMGCICLKTTFLHLKLYYRFI